MNIKLTVYLTALLALAVVAVVFVINPRHEAAEQMQSKRVFHIQRTGAVSTIDLKNGNGSFTLNKNSQGTWVIISPVATGADQTVVNALLTALTTLSYKKKIGTGTLSAFGLSPASITATVTLRDKQAYSLQIGAAAPLGKNYYAVASNGTRGIFTVTSWIRGQLDDTLFQLRDKAPITVSRNDLSAIGFTSNARPVYTLRRKNGVWFITKPKLNRVRPSVVNGMVFQLENLRASNIIDSGMNPGAMGLEKPSEVISILLMDGKNYTITIGKHEGPDHVYAMVSGKKPVYVINTGLVTALKKNTGGMVDTRLLTEDTFAVSALTVIRDGKAVVLTRKSYNTWEKNGVPFTDSGVVNDLVGTLTTMKASRFVGNRSLLKQAVLTFTVSGTVQPVTTTIAIGPVNAGTVYARTSIDPRLAVVAPADARRIETEVRTIFQ